MLKKILQSVFTNPRVYDHMQIFFGFRRKCRILRKHIPLPPPDQNLVVLDLGGGTGLFREFWPSSVKYVCLDNEMQKLQGFLSKYPNGKAVFADAAHIPVRSSSVDVVMCTSMSHHIPLDQLNLMVQEVFRVLKKSGKFIFIDAVLINGKWLNALLWKLDRGVYPHTEQSICSVLESHCEISCRERFSIYYDYLLAVGIKR